MRDVPSSSQPPTDVRMKGFARRSKVEDAIAWVDSVVRCLPKEDVPLAEAAGRVLAEEVVSRVAQLGSKPKGRRAAILREELALDTTLGVL